MTTIYCDFFTCEYNSGKTDSKPGKCSRESVYLIKCAGEMVCDMLGEKQPEILIGRGRFQDNEDKTEEREVEKGGN